MLASQLYLNGKLMLGLLKWSLNPMFGLIRLPHFLDLTPQKRCFNWPWWILMTIVTSVRMAGQGCHLEDGKGWLSNRARCHRDGVLRRVALMDGDYLEGRRRYVEVCEPGILQMMKVTLCQSVPEVDNAELLKNYKFLQDETWVAWILHEC